MRRTGRNSLVLVALVLAASRVLAADELGTLFTTPEERARLDRLRRGEPVAASTESGAIASRHKPSITGYVQRSDGRDTVWIDGRPVVVAAPGDKVLDPTIVRSRPSDRVLHVEPQSQEPQAQEPR